MIKQTIAVDERIIRSVQAQLSGIEHKAPNVIANALNRTMSNLAANINREVRAKYNIKTSDIKGSLEKKRANKNNLSASIKSKSGVIGLDHFKVSPLKVQPKRKKPIKTAVKKGATKSLPGGFVQDVNGLKVFVRNTKKRLPIRRLYGPSIPQMIENENIRDELDLKASAMFKQRLDHEISRLIERSTS